MALKAVCFLLLLDLTLLIHGVASFCNVTCTTDYESLLNCSCSGALPTYPVLINVTCSNEGEEEKGSCEVKWPQSWCIIHQEDLYEVGTICNSTATSPGNPVAMDASLSSIWELSDVVKPVPPSEVQVTSHDEFYNITWVNHNPIGDCFSYTVRVRESKHLSKNPVFQLLTEKQFLELRNDRLKPNVNYSVDIQSKLCTNFVRGPWSEWSETAAWRTRKTSKDDGVNWLVVYILLAIGLVLLLLSLPCLKVFLQKKINLISIPSPDEFFKPLYHKYDGNFKEWVKPTFNEYDYLNIDCVQMVSEKHHNILQWNNEKQSYTEDNETKQNSHFLHMLQPQNNLQLHFQDGSSSEGTSHSMGHISIHTVTLSGEEFEEEVMLQSSINTLRSYQDGESFGSFEDDNREHSGYDLEGHRLSRIDRQSGMLPQHEHQIFNEISVEIINFQPPAQFDEPERVSLDSFISNEQSEDGYPHVDLDTIDSGFVECSSPGALDSNTEIQLDSDLFHEHKNSNSNYVKQWMICNTIQEDSSNSENELRETQ